MGVEDLGLHQPGAASTARPGEREDYDQAGWPRFALNRGPAQSVVRLGSHAVDAASCRSEPQRFRPVVSHLMNPAGRNAD
jgi:hypothetical protein